MPHSALDHGCGRHAAVGGQEVFLERAGVDADADGHLPFPRRPDDLPDLVQGTDVPGVDPEPVDARLERSQGQPMVEMDVGDERGPGPGS